MTDVFADIFALLCGVAGWFYLFYSNAAAHLAAMESPVHLKLRVRLRRICGAALVLMGICIYAGGSAINEHRYPAIYLGVWMAVIFLLFVVMILVAADIQFTRNLRRKLREQAQRSRTDNSHRKI